MRISDYTYRTQAWLKHYFSARHTKGNGIHSPSLFYLVRMLFYDDNPYYCFHEIEKQRFRLQHYKRAIHVEDYGTGQSGERTIAHIARTSLANPKEAQLLFRLVNHLKPQYILELGTSLGITTAYLAKAAEKATVHTLEGSTAIAEVASDTFQRLKIENINQHVGNINDTLNDVLTNMPAVDFAYIDANHTEEATWRYFTQIADKCRETSVLVVDDIHYSKGMHQAWKRIQRDARVTTTMDLYDFGLVFFDKQYMRKNYIINL